MYEAPTTERIRIELESDFMTASVVKEDPESGVGVNGQEWEELDAGDMGWNDTEWK